MKQQVNYLYIGRCICIFSSGTNNSADFTYYVPEKNSKDECGYRDDVVKVDCISGRRISQANVVKTRNCEPVGEEKR